MNIESSMVNYYAERAKEYERIYHKPDRQEELGQLRTLLQRTFADTHILEIACGTGYWTEVITPSAASVVATDINEAVLTIARSKPIDHQKTTFRIADAYSLPPFPEQFNAGLAAFWWSHIPKAKLRAFLQNFRRSFSPGATLVFIDNCYVEGSSTPISRADEQGNTYQLRKLDDGSQHEVLKNFPAEPELLGVLGSLTSEARLQFMKYYWILTCRTLP